MITEKGTIVTEFNDFYGAAKQLVKKPMIISIIFIVVGAVGIVAYFAFYWAFILLYDPPVWEDFLLLSALPLGLGIGFVVMFVSRVKQATKIADRKNVYEFYSDCLMAKEVRGGVVVAVVKFDYAKIVKTKEIENYLFFCYEVKSTAYPLDKFLLDAKELATVKSLFKIDVKGAEILTLPAYGSAEMEGVYTP